MNADRFVALPARAEMANLAIVTAIFALTFLLCYGGASALSAYVPWRVPMALALDEQLPFIPGAAILYLTIAPMLLLAPFVLRSLASILPLFAALMLETVVGAVCFMLLPVDPPAIDCCEPGIAGALFRVADVLNLERNDLPSLHVAFAFTLAAAFSPRARPRRRGAAVCLGRRHGAEHAAHASAPSARCRRWCNAGRDRLARRRQMGAPARGAGRVRRGVAVPA